MEHADSEPPFDGDPSWHVSRHLESGAEISIRPIGPADREGLRRAFRETSPETRYLRFLTRAFEPSEDVLTYLTCVDQKDHVAIVATTPSPDLKVERGVGVARFIRLGGHADVAEAAITVVDDMQQRGIGSVLARELERAARARGVRRFRAEVLADNAAMRAILETAGARVLEDAVPEAGTITYEVALEPPRVAERLRAILRGAALTMALSMRRLVPSGAAATRGHEARHREGAQGDRRGGRSSGGRG